MRIIWRVLIGLLVIMMLVGCGTTNSNAISDVQVSAETSQGARLRDDYDEALSVQGQLAAGTLLLEETELEVDEALAAELLPLWRAVQSLINSDTAAALEIEAVYNQIQDTMTPDQISTIAEMELTEETLATMLEEGELVLGRGSLFGERSERPGSGEQLIPPEGGSGRPGGGFPGGGLGQGPGGGLPEGLDAEAMATRQAQFAGNDQGSFQERGLIMAVILTLELETGDISEDRPIRPFDVVYSVVAEATGLSLEEIQVNTAEGVTLAEIVETSGSDLEEVRNSLIEALRELPNAADWDLEQLASEWLGMDE